MQFLQFALHRPYTCSLQGEGTSKDLEVCEEEKDLGVTVDPMLKSSNNTEVIANKANRIVDLIKLGPSTMKRSSGLSIRHS